MSGARYEPVTGLLPSGKVLIAGGYDGTATPSYRKGAELFDPATGTFEKISAELNIGRDEAASVVLPGGKVLIAGGYNETIHDLGGGELFNPETGKFELIAAEMTTRRDGPEAALLPDGKALIVGGLKELGVVKSAELYNPATQTFEAVPGEMHVERYEPAVATLPNGKVLVAGGWNKSDKYLRSAEIFDPATGSFELLEGSAHQLAANRDETGFTALANGKVLIVGGFGGEQLKTAELFNPETNTFELLPSELAERRTGPAAVLLPGGKVLVVGGYNGKADLKTAEMRGVEAPLAVTTPASGVGVGSATLNGNAVGETASTVRFQSGTSTAYGASTPAQTLAASILPRAATATLNGLAPSTTYHFRIVAENAGGPSYGADQTFTTAPAPVLIPGRCGICAPPRRPTVTNVSESHRVWRRGNRLARISRKAPIGTTFSFNLNQQAAVSFTFTQQVSGRKLGGRCVAPTKANRAKHACRRVLTRGTLSFAGHAGANRVAFQGRLSRSKKLPPGTYTLVIVATNGPGRRSPPKQLTFTIVK
jgi:hypothetical protein